MCKERLNGNKPLLLRPEDLTEGDIFGSGTNGEKNGILTQFGSSLNGFLVQQEDLGRILQDGNISDAKYRQDRRTLEEKYIELEHMTSKRISRDVATINCFRDKFNKIVATRMDELTNPNIVDKQRELVTIK